MAPTAELALIPLKPGSDLSTPTTPASTILNSTLETVLSQDGAQRAFYGTKHEAPSQLVLLIDWDTLEHHKKFMDSTEYGPFVKHLMTICDSPPSLHHTTLQPSEGLQSYHPTIAGPNVSATEFLIAFQSPSTSDSDRSALTKNMQSLFATAKSASVPGYAGACCGSLLEPLALPSEPKGEKHLATLMMVGWDSVASHQAFRETELFKSNIGLLRDAPELKGMDVAHVSFVEKSKGLGNQGTLPSVQGEILNPQQGTVQTTVTKDGPAPAE